MKLRRIALVAALLVGGGAAGAGAVLPDCTGAAKLKLRDSSHDAGSTSWFWVFELRELEVPTQ